MKIFLTWLKGVFSNGQNISLFIIIGLVAYILYSRKQDSSTITDNVKQIQILQVRVDSLKKKIIGLNPKLDSTNRAIDTVKTKIRYNETRLQDIQKSAKKSDSILNTYSSDELQKYFTDY
jgi:peptidoglycan hydrolase CwlO-like protein